MRGDRLLAIICVLGFSAPALAEEPAPDGIAAQIAFKQAAIDALQREVDQLCLQQGLSTQLMFHVRMVEVNLTRLPNEGLGVWILGEPGEAGQPPAAGECVLSAKKAKGYQQVLEHLQKKNVAQLISDPTLVTIPGRPAHFNEGGELPAGKDANGQPIYKKFGTEFEVNARRIGSNRISAKVMLRVSTPEELPSKSGEGPQYAFRVRQCDTCFELNAGETFFLRGAPQAKTVVKHDPVRDETQTVEEQTMLQLMVTPEIIEGPIPGAMTTVQTATQNTFDASGFPAPMVTTLPPGVPYPGAQQPPQPVAAPGRPAVVYLPNPVPVPDIINKSQHAAGIDVSAWTYTVSLNQLRKHGIEARSVKEVCEQLGLACREVDGASETPASGGKQLVVDAKDLESAAELRQTMTKNGVLVGQTFMQSHTRDGGSAGGGSQSQKWQSTPDGAPPMADAPKQQENFEVKMRPRVLKGGVILVEFTALREVTGPTIVSPTPIAEPVPRPRPTFVQRNVLVNAGQYAVIDGGTIEQPSLKAGEDATPETYIYLHLVTAKVHDEMAPAAVPAPAAYRQGLPALWQRPVGPSRQFTPPHISAVPFPAVYPGIPMPVPAPAAPLVADDSRRPINIQAVIAEVNLTKLRALGHKVDNEQQVYELFGMPFEKGPLAKIDDHEAVEKRVRPLMEQGAFSILSSPQIITLDGQDASVSCGSRCPVTGRDTGISLKLVPHQKDDGQIQIDFTGTFTAPKPVPADAPADYAKNAVAVREMQTSFLAAPHQTIVLPGGFVVRETKSTENGVEKTGVEEIMPLYFVTASVPELQEARAVRAVRSE